MRVYNYIFFKIYQILSAFDESPSFASIIVMCWLFLFNSFTLIDYVFQSDVVSAFFKKYSSIPFVIMILAVHFFYFYHNEKHVRIYEKYKNEGKNSAIFGSIGVVLYIFLSILVFFKYTVPYMGGSLK